MKLSGEEEVVEKQEEKEKKKRKVTADEFSKEGVVLWEYGGG